MANSVILERFLIPGSRRTASARPEKRQRIYILPTRHGLVFSLMLIVMLIGSINYSNSLAYVLTFLLGSMLLAGILYTYRNLAGVIITYQKPKAVFAGQTAEFPFWMNNESCPHRYSISMNQQTHIFSWFRRNSESITQFDDLPEDQNSRIFFKVGTQHRGELSLQRIRISTSFPLGLFRAWSYLYHDEACLVYPKPEGSLPLPRPESGDDVFRIGDDEGMDDFNDFRNYRAGDSSHAISWKHYARSDTLIVKRFKGLGSQQYRLRWSDTEVLGDREQRLSQLARWILELEQLGHLYALGIPGFSNRFDRGLEHRHECLKQLALFPDA